MKREISSSEIDSANQSKRPKLANTNDAPATPQVAETDNASTPSKSSRRGDRSKNERQHMIRRKTSKAKPSGRTKKCGDCAGCNRDDCGSCQVCRINQQFKGQLKLGTAECLQKACLNPVALTMSTVQIESGSFAMTAMMAVQEDGTCPFKEVDGKLIDFRCYICKKLPRVGCANRSELYRHYSKYHFTKQLIEEFGTATTCQVAGCRMAGTKITKGKIADHMGQVHNYVDKYLPEENRIPIKVQKARGQSSKSRKTGGGRSSRIVFPQIPEGYNPKTNQVITEESMLEVEGFKISMENRRTAKLNVPEVPELDYSGYAGVFGCCNICPGAQPHTIQDIIQHLVLVHRMSIGCIPEPHPIRFLLREGIIREDKTTVTTSVETTCQSPIPEQSSIELSPFHGFDADKDAQENEFDKEEVVDLPGDGQSPDSSCDNAAINDTEISEDNLKPSASVSTITADISEDNLKLSSEVPSINISCEGLPTIHKQNVEAIEMKVGRCFSSESIALETKDNTDSEVWSKLGLTARDSIESTNKENIVPEAHD